MNHTKKEQHIYRFRYYKEKLQESLQKIDDAITAGRLPDQVDLCLLQTDLDKTKKHLEEIFPAASTAAQEEREDDQTAHDVIYEWLNTLIEEYSLNPGLLPDQLPDKGYPIDLILSSVTTVKKTVEKRFFIPDDLHDVLSDRLEYSVECVLCDHLKGNLFLDDFYHVETEEEEGEEEVSVC